KSSDAVLKEQKVGMDGLSQTEVMERLNQYGKNELAEKKKHGRLYRFFSQFKDIMLIILLIAAGINTVIALVEQVYTDLVDVAIILTIVLLNAIVGYIQENKAEDALNTLKKMSQPFARVKRAGVIQNVLTTDIVPGDIIVLEAGDVCCADVRLIESASLQCDESSLTGESTVINKDATTVLPNNTALGDRVNMVFGGSVITYGRGVGVVVATGMNTEMGKIAKLLDVTEDETTPIQQKLNKLGKVISVIIILIALVIFLINVVLGSSNVVDALMLSIAIAVAAIPESLPAVITVILSLGVSRMSKQRAIIRKMHAVETLGSCQVICSDKTGTLTQNKMAMQTIVVDNEVVDCDKLDAGKYQIILRAMTLCTDVSNGAEGLVGDPTEIALVEYASSKGVNKFILQRSMQRVAELPFDSNRKMMTTFNKSDDKIIGYTKGAPDVLLSRCNRVLLNGKISTITAEMTQTILDNIELLSSKGLRTLGVAYKVHRTDSYSLADEQDLIFVGVLGMRDPPRPEAREAVAMCKSAGIIPVMITGDHVTTAREIAKEVGIYEDGDMVLTGAELDKLSDEKYRSIIEKVSVYARVSPENKVRIVDTWKALGKVVAMTGDGVNDAPSIKRADIGVGMGVTGTEVTKEVADMVLTDDNFATIVGAVKEGRKTYQNIKKVILFLFATNIVEVMSLLLVTLIAPELMFLSAIQILFINLVTDTLPAISLSVEASEPDIMQRPPREKHEGLFAGNMWNLVVASLWQVLVVVGTFFVVYNVTMENMLAVTMSFGVLSTTQLFHMLNVRQEKSIFTQNPFRNKILWMTIILGVLINIIIVSIPSVASVFGLVSMTAIQWLIVVGLALTIIPVMEIFKCIRQIRNK
ncbi:MAG: calcium-translocating P-type ATPase, PMCA-type, partial [Clostridia bacterium]|nr:calcium-translocating P-type ATPase, PMCA-type [Clostridia bacterium]